MFIAEMIFCHTFYDTEFRNSCCGVVRRNSRSCHNSHADGELNNNNRKNSCIDNKLQQF